MKILRRRGAIGHTYVALRAECQEALKTGARVLRPLSLMSVGQQQHQASGLTPLGESCNDELIDYDLSAVGEVTELRFPQHQCVWRADAVTVFESQGGILRERAVVQFEGCCGAREMLGRRVLLAGSAVVEHEVALRKRATLGVLASEP